MLYEVKIKEIYEYTTFIEAKDDQELDDIVHQEIPILIDMSEEEISKIKEDKKSDFLFYNELEWYERGE